VARVALNLRGIAADFPARGMALVEAGRWTLTKLVDVRLSGRGPLRLPPEVTLHIGSARTLARVRLFSPGGNDPPQTPPAPGGKPFPPDPLGPLAGIARLTLREALPLHVGDRLLLRDPGSAGVTILGATVLDVAPPAHVSSPPGRTSRPPRICCAGTSCCGPARWRPWA
jgi:selenocysteine-specific elongation factor